ncbi:hypothetical protein F511_34637 [Dorcoceras hygrometricum]|uniref:Uncharacterized protein n=1 Tax=Dorcoceras hygrometricum TaxID=472368 RepID=A0A2Z7BXB8_9LAMI|nr:hypothetical protein F511_34637 [Dorcoceras hygrometricum]
MKQQVTIDEAVEESEKDEVIEQKLLAKFLLQALRPAASLLFSRRRRRRRHFDGICSGLVFRGESDRADLVRTSSAVRRRSLGSGRGPDWRIYRNLPRSAGFLKHRLEPGTSAREVTR